MEPENDGLLSKCASSPQGVHWSLQLRRNSLQETVSGRAGIAHPQCVSPARWFFTGLPTVGHVIVPISLEKKVVE